MTDSSDPIERFIFLGSHPLCRRGVYLKHIGLSAKERKHLLDGIRCGHETMLQIGPKEAWLWVAVEPIHIQILGVYISKHRTMIVVES